MENVTEISSEEEENLLIIKPKKVNLEKEKNVSFTVKTIPGDGHCIVNIFMCFLARTPTKFSLHYGTNSGNHSLINRFQ